MALGTKIRSSTAYQVVTLQSLRKRLGDDKDEDKNKFIDNPSDPRIFAVLRETVARERGGYIFPDLGILNPAPSGTARGLGMVSFAYTKCQINCMAGVYEEKNAGEETEQQRKAREEKLRQITPDPSSVPKYRQEEVLIRIPLSYQMTRQVALDTLTPLLPNNVHARAPLSDLDDAALLVLLLSHERGLGRASRWHPYISTLPKQPGCGYAEAVRPLMLDSLEALSEEIGIDTRGWDVELAKAGKYADRIATGLAKDYGAYLTTKDGYTAKESIKWALCQVASRATAGSQKHGALRLIPVIDLINHDVSAGALVELTGKERLGK